MSFNNGVIVFPHALLINFLLIFACDKIFSLFKHENPVSLIFDSGLLLSVISLIYFPCVLLFFFLLAVLTVVRSVNFREWAIALVGFILPYYFMFVYAFLTDSLENTFHNLLSKFTLHHFEIAFRSEER